MVSTDPTSGLKSTGKSDKAGECSGLQPPSCNQGKCVVYSLRYKITNKIYSILSSPILMQYICTFFLFVVFKRYRGLLARRWYWEKLSILILLQSVCRMYPKRCYYKRLKKTTIKCQAWSRRTVKKIQYLRLKRCTIVVQKYVRRMLGISKKWRLFHANWRSLETKMGLSVFVQTRWREKKAKIKLVKIRKQHQNKQQAALRLQALWYKHKGAFHTFLLMCCYRSIDEIEKNLATLGKSLGRGFAARLVQRYYKHRYYERLVAAAGCIQRWYRGAKGYNYVMLLRRKKWVHFDMHIICIYIYIFIF